MPVLMNASGSAARHLHQCSFHSGKFGKGGTHFLKTFLRKKTNKLAVESGAPITLATMCKRSVSNPAYVFVSTVAYIIRDYLHVAVAGLRPTIQK